MLTQPAVLWAVSDVGRRPRSSIAASASTTTSSAPTRSPFPSGLINSPDIVAALAALPTEIEKSNYRLHENPVCTGCHGNIDPYGLRARRLRSGRQRAHASPTDIPVDQTRRLLARAAAVGHDHRAGRVRAGDHGRQAVHRLRRADDVQLRHRPHDPRERHLRGAGSAQEDVDGRRHDHRAVPSTSRPPRSRARAREVPSESYKMARRAFLRGARRRRAAAAPACAASRPTRRACRRRCASWSSTTRWARSTKGRSRRSICGARRPPRPPPISRCRRTARRSRRCSSKMVMIDGLNIVAASQVPGGNNGGKNTHEGGMVALMTGVPTLGPIGTQDHAAGGPSIDQIFLDQSPVLGGQQLPPSASKTTVPVAGAGRRHPLRPRRGRAARAVVSPAAAAHAAVQSEAAVNSARQPLFPETAAAQRLQPHVQQRGRRSRGGGGQAGAAEERARLHPRRPGPHAHAGARQRDQQAGQLRRRRSSSWRPASGCR